MILCTLIKDAYGPYALQNTRSIMKGAISQKKIIYIMKGVVPIKTIEL